MLRDYYIYEKFYSIISNENFLRFLGIGVYTKIVRLNLISVIMTVLYIFFVKIVDSFLMWI